MTSSSIHFKVGTRGSNLALRQTRNALDRCEAALPGVSFESVVVSTPGDRDLSTDLRVTPGDFFSRDLDRALRNHEVDCAVHSAKDLPPENPQNIDRFWLPWREDPRDAILLPAGATELPTGNFRIGVSSDRREQYCRKRFPEAELTSIRGNIEQRLQQLDNGEFDMVVMAVAALNRLNIQERIFEFIPLEDLQVPEGQGTLAMTYRKGDSRFIALRNFLLHPVVFAGAGIGSVDNVTTGVIKALQRCDVCLHDALMPAELLDYLPARAVRVPVGKRSGCHSVKQDEICSRLLKFALQGHRVVRLKGGDPTVFGRLAEEVDVLQEQSLPFRVLPGLGAMSVSAASTGILPSRRNIARGFTVMTPRKARSSEFEAILPEERLRLPQVFYMATRVLDQLTAQYRDEGFPADTPVAVVFDAGTTEETVLHGTLSDIVEKRRLHQGTGPGLVFVGEPAADKFRFCTHAPLENVRVMYCGAAGGVDKASAETDRFGGKLLARPTIELEVVEEAKSCIRTLQQYDYMMVTSPACARLFLEACLQEGMDLRKLPGIMVCGPGTADPFREYGIHPDVLPQNDYGADGLRSALQGMDLKGKRLIRLRSDKATSTFAQELSDKGIHVDEVVFYRNRRIGYDKPEFADAIVFTSTSSVASFIESFGTEQLLDKRVCAIGNPTAQYLKENTSVTSPLIATERTIPGCIATLAGAYVVDNLKHLQNA